MSFWLYRFTRWTVGIIFLYSGPVKLIAPRIFAVLIEAYGLVPETLVVPVAVLLPAIEVAVAWGLLFDIRGSLAITAGLMILFMAILGYGIHMGFDIDCGCFGGEDPEAEAFHGLRLALCRDAVIMVGIVYLYIWRKKQSVRPIGLTTSLKKIIQIRGFIMKTIKTIFTFSFLSILVAGLTINAQAAKNQFEKEVDKEQDAVKLVREVQRGGYGVITTEELKNMMEENKTLLIIDTMPYEASYKKAHVPGAVQFLFPIPEMETWDISKTGSKTKADFTELLGPDKNKTIVIYCGFVKCTRSHNGAAWAKKLGYKNVYRYPGGIFAWKGAKYEVEEVK